MFVGTWLYSEFWDFVPRYRKPDDEWTHWKVVLSRGRYSDCAIINVKCEIFRARKPSGRWVVAEKPDVAREVYLGNVRFDDKRMRTPREEKTEADPKVIAELRAAFSGIERHIKIATSHGLGFQHQEIDASVILACLKPS